MKPWKVIDRDGDDIMSADSVTDFASMYRTTPRLFAKQHARDISTSDDQATAVPAYGPLYRSD